MFVWQKNMINSIEFVMVDANGAEVTGLGGTFTLELCQPIESFAASAGTKTEIGSGWYRYVTTAAEAATSGTVGIKITAAGCVQQNMIATVEGSIGSTIYPTVNDPIQTAGGAPVAGVKIECYSDSGYTTLVQTTTSDINGNWHFHLNSGNYWFRIVEQGYEMAVDGDDNEWSDTIA